LQIFRRVNDSPERFPSASDFGKTGNG
jgi:hypothetical protein